MYERQVHKEGITKAVLTEGDGEAIERHFSLNELSQMFKLGKPGVAKFMDKVNGEHAAAGLMTNWSDHHFVVNHPGVIGLSRHDALYNGTASIATDAAPTIGDVVLGRSQKVLQKSLVKESLHVLQQSSSEGTSFTPSGVVTNTGQSEHNLVLVGDRNHDCDENAPNVASVQAVSTGSFQSNNQGDSVKALDVSLARAAALKQAGKPRKALHVLMTFLDSHKDNLDPINQKRLQDATICHSRALGLM